MRYFGTLISRGGFVLSKYRGRLEAFGQYGILGQPSGGTIRSAPMTGFFRSTLFLMFAAIMLLGLMVALFGGQHSEVASLALFAMGRTATPPDTDKNKPRYIKQLEADHKKLLRELEEGQLKMSEGPITQEEGEALEQKAQEAEEKQVEIDRYNRISGVNAKSRQVQRPVLPGEQEHIARKFIWTTPGHIFAYSDSLRDWKASGASQGFSKPVVVGRRLSKKTKIYGEEALKFEKKAFDAATLPDLGTDAVIAIDRDPEIVRFEEPEVLTIRDVLNVTTTNSDMVRFVKHIATTRAAESQATRGALKKYLTVEFDKADAPVQTIAVLSKVTEQDIADAPRLVGMINGEMQLDLRVEEERQIVWGDGTNGTLIGLFDPTIGIPEFTRAGVNDTLIDTVRRMRTDLRKRHMLPTFVAIDPLDWEEIELVKGSDEHYLWGLISDLRGPRIWSLRVVESDAMTNAETGERRLLMGDGVRGATLYDREGIQLAVGLVDDDFARNLRTLRAEERLALAVKRSFAFEYTVTGEAGS